ncbi:MAG: trigger factor [Fimbriimonadaceae bacterium]
MSASASEMSVKRTDLNACTIQLDVVCTQEQVNKGFERAVRDFAKKVRVPGFRPGAAPKAMVEKMVPEEDLANAAVEIAVRSALRQALEQSDVTPEDAPAVTVTKFDRDAAELEFMVKVPLSAKVTLGDYKSLSAKKPIASVDPGEVEYQIEELRRRSGTQKAVTGRGVQEGDVAVVHIRAEGVDGEGKTFMTKAGQTFPALDAAILGMEAEGIKHAKLNFPDNFQDKDWAGKEYECTITIRSVSSVQVPEVEELVASLNVKDTSELEKRVSEGIVSAKEKIGEDMVSEQLLDALIRSSEVEVADPTWERVGARRLQEIAIQLRDEGSSLEQYAEQNGMTVDELVQAQMSEAKLHVQRATLVREVFVKEEMRITDEDANFTFQDILRENKVGQEDVQAFMKENGPQLREEVVFRTMFRKVLDVLRQNANVQEVDPSELGLDQPAGPAAKAPSAQKPAAKKPTAKKASAKPKKD